MIRALLAALLGAVAAFADEPPSPVTVQAIARPDRTTIGTRVRYEVEVLAPKGVEVVVAQPAERIGDMEIVDFGTEPPAAAGDGRVSLKRWWQLVAWSPGRHPLASPEVRYRLPGQELQTAPGADLGVTVESLVDQATDASDIRDIKPPEPIPVDWRPYWAIGAALVALAVLALGVRWLAGRRRRTVALPPPLPAHVVAATALAELRARRLVEAGAVKEYYSALTDIVRRYLEGRFQLRAPEMTTEEFLLATARDGRLLPAHRRLLGDFLAESDLVKFARHRPAIADTERAFDAARRFVEETAPAAGSEAA